MATKKIDTTKLEGVENSYDERPVRPCMSCGANDRAPRVLKALPDGNTAYYHVDCAAMLGDAVAQKLLEAVGTTPTTDGLKNEELWLTIVDKSNLNPGSATENFFNGRDVTGSYQAAIDAGEIQDVNWNKKEMN